MLVLEIKTNNLLHSWKGTRVLVPNVPNDRITSFFAALFLAFFLDGESTRK